MAHIALHARKTRKKRIAARFTSVTPRRSSIRICDKTSSAMIRGRSALWGNVRSSLTRLHCVGEEGSNRPESRYCSRGLVVSLSLSLKSLVALTLFTSPCPSRLKPLSREALDFMRPYLLRASQD